MVPREALGVACEQKNHAEKKALLEAKEHKKPRAVQNDPEGRPMIY